MRIGRSRRLVVPFVLAATALAASPSSATAHRAQEDEAGIQLTLEPALVRQHHPGDHVAMRVIVAADRLVAGTVEIARAGSDLEVRRTVEVAGGASKQLIVLLPTSIDEAADVRAELVADDDVLASASTNLTSDADTDVAGILPALTALLPELPPRATLPATQRRVDLVALPADVLDLGPAALDQLDSIVGRSSDVGALTPEGRVALFAWIAGGGRLLLDDADDLSAIPTPWRPGVTGYALAGAGEVRVVDGAAQAGAWAAVLDPASAGLDPRMGMIQEVFVPSQVTLGQRSGVRLPDLTVLIVVLAIYVLVLGPIAYLVLRRLRRLTLAWVVIPALAAATAGAVLVTGASWRSSGRPTANVAVEVHPSGATASADVLLFNRSGGTTQLDLPAGWTVDEPVETFFSQPSPVRRTAAVDDQATTIEATLEPGQLVELNASGPVVAGDIDVTVTAEGADRVIGTVTNTGTSTLRATAVMARGSAALVGDLAPGEQRSFTLGGLVVDGFASLGDRVWSDPELGVGFAAPTPAVDFGLWSSFAAKQGVDLYPSGTVRVAGWVDDRPVELGAGEPLDARTLITRVVPIAVADGAPVPAIAVRATAVALPFDARFGEQQEGTYRFVLPPIPGERSYEVVVPEGLTDPEVWTTDDEWVAITRRDGSDAFAIPANAVRRGVVLLKLAASPELGFEFDQSSVPSMASVTDG